jgi:citronellol/citronellal dehydrogenase
VRKVGGQCLPIKCDIRDEKSVKEAVELTVKTFGGIDILVNNASALYLAKAEETSMKQYDLAMSINARGTFLVSKYCIPHLRNAKNPHILTISPPLYSATDPKVNWYARLGVGYTIAKLGMTMITHGLSEELAGDGVGCNTLWPRTMIATAAVQNLLGGVESMRKSRTPDIMGDAAYEIITSDSRKTTDQCFFDDEVLLSVHGQGLDLSKYRALKDGKETDLVADFIC